MQNSPQNSQNQSNLSNAEQNKLFWDSISTTFYTQLGNLPSGQAMYKQLKNSILQNAQFDPEKTEVMDFACGTGVISALLAPHAKRIVGVDISQGMVGAYNATIQTEGIKNAHAIRAELKLDSEEPRLKGEKFDVIFCAQSYKHIEDNIAITKVLKSYLKPKGILIVIDFIKGKANPAAVFEGAGDIVKAIREHVHQNLHINPTLMRAPPSGYVKEDLQAIFEAADLKEFDYQEAFSEKNKEAEFALFLAKGVNYEGVSL